MAAEIVPQATLTWVRTLAANRVAVDGDSWVAEFRKNNSGTINNQCARINSAPSTADAQAATDAARPPPFSQG